jgi:hypothetical protein
MLYQLSYSGATAMVRDISVVSFGHGPAEATGKLGLMEHPKKIGDRTTLAVMMALDTVGAPFLVPFGENTRYDLVIDEATRLARVQCKTGRLRQGAVRFKVCSMYLHHPNPKIHSRDYRGDVDYFAVYCPETGGVYLVPIEDLPMKTRASLRVEPSRNSQQRGIRFASDYLIALVSASRAERRQFATERLPGMPGAAGSSA